MARPTGSKNTIPALPEQKKLIEQLTANAVAGDSLALGLLLILCELKRSNPF